MLHNFRVFLLHILLFILAYLPLHAEDLFSLLEENGFEVKTQSLTNVEGDGFPENFLLHFKNTEEDTNASIIIDINQDLALELWDFGVKNLLDTLQNAKCTQNISILFSANDFSPLEMKKNVSGTASFIRQLENASAKTVLIINPSAKSTQKAELIAGSEHFTSPFSLVSSIEKSFARNKIHLTMPHLFFSIYRLALTKPSMRLAMFLENEIRCAELNLTLNDAEISSIKDFVESYSVDLSDWNTHYIFLTAFSRSIWLTEKTFVTILILIIAISLFLLCEVSFLFGKNSLQRRSAYLKTQIYIPISIILTLFSLQIGQLCAESISKNGFPTPKIIFSTIKFFLPDDKHAQRDDKSTFRDEKTELQDENIVLYDEKHAVQTEKQAMPDEIEIETDENIVLQSENHSVSGEKRTVHSEKQAVPVTMQFGIKILVAFFITSLLFVIQNRFFLISFSEQAFPYLIDIVEIVNICLFSSFDVSFIVLFAMEYVFSYLSRMLRSIVPLLFGIIFMLLPFAPYIFEALRFIDKNNFELIVHCSPQINLLFTMIILPFEFMWLRILVRKQKVLIGYAFIHLFVSAFVIFLLTQAVIFYQKHFIKDKIDENEEITYEIIKSNAYNVVNAAINESEFLGMYTKHLHLQAKKDILRYEISVSSQSGSPVFDCAYDFDVKDGAKQASFTLPDNPPLDFLLSYSSDNTAETIIDIKAWFFDDNRTIIMEEKQISR